MTSTVTIRHNAEMGHRLPMLPGKCQSLHGHSWWFEVEIGGPLDEDGIVLEYGKAKAAFRSWVDEHLDHGVCLGALDPLAELLSEHGKVAIVPSAGWPTVETMAWWTAQVMDTWLLANAPHCRVVRCTATETHVNAATWRPS